MPAKKTKRWVAKVKTDSTHPPEGLFTKSADAELLHQSRWARAQRLLSRRTRKSQGSAFKADPASKNAKACCMKSYKSRPSERGTAALRVMFNALEITQALHAEVRRWTA